MNKEDNDVEILGVKTNLSDKRCIVLYNDEVNTFDFVIESLIGICNHSLEQAEQCAMITHYNGKCTVKTGSLKDLKSPCSSLLGLGLSVSIK